MYLQQSKIVREVGFVTFNGNRVLLTDVTLECVLPKLYGLVVLEDKPRRPRYSAFDLPHVGSLASHFPRPGRLTVNDLPDRYEIHVQFGKLQAEANAWSDSFFIGTNESCELPVRVQLFADELTSPRIIDLLFCTLITQSTMNKLPPEELKMLLQDD